MEKPKLTQFSHGSGCGCKIAPADLEAILGQVTPGGPFPALLVGNATKDDAAVMEWENGECIVSTVDFFTPVVDDARDFGRIAAANAISDVYAMGGTPLMAVAILGWPVEQLGTALATEVIEGAQATCAAAGLPLAGGHSIDSREPFFGLAVTGRVHRTHLKQNNGAQPGDLLFLTKPLGVGIVATAMKRGLASAQDSALIVDHMSALNDIGEALGKLEAVHAMTDVTGFGLLGHLIELCEASNTGAQLNFSQIPLLPGAVLDPYLSKFIMPDNTMRNFKALGPKASKLSARQLQLLCDPQTNGGLLIAVSAEGAPGVQALLQSRGLESQPIGTVRANQGQPLVTVFEQE